MDDERDVEMLARLQALIEEELIRGGWESIYNILDGEGMIYDRDACTMHIIPSLAESAIIAIRDDLVDLRNDAQRLINRLDDTFIQPSGVVPARPAT